MQWTGLNELREKYLSFFESKGHLRHNSYSLVPQGDKSLLLINAGMAPLKKYFTGELEPPRRRMTTCQKCIRTPDIERVGITARHGTYFEMLGNFSFGDYFKKEATAWAWEFCTEVLKMPVDRLWVTIYEQDDEAFEIWTKLVGVSESRIVRLGKQDNFWEHGSGPCGPCSEIYFDRGEKYGCGKPDCAPGCDCDRYTEFWNLVFTQFDNDGNGNYTRLKSCNIDTGMGLERLACIMQGVDNLFEVDTVKNIMAHIIEVCGVKYHQDEKKDVSLRVITDHIRGTTFMIGDGVMPSNEGRGYVLRRLLRRAARHGKLLGVNEPFLYLIADTVIKENKTAYPELAEKRDLIVKVIRAEEESFSRTVDIGLSLLEQMLSRLEGKVLSGEAAFKLQDTYGFPIDLTKELLSERGFSVDEDGFGALVEKSRSMARQARKSSDNEAWKSQSVPLKDIDKTAFCGYEELENESEICALISNGERVDFITAGTSAMVVLKSTCFYARGGGQQGDSGVITAGDCVFTVEDTTKTDDGVYLHHGVLTAGESLCVGQTAKAEVDRAKRLATMRNHTAAHLLQAALRNVLGTHVEQAGQLVDDKITRFDFTHFSALTAEQLRLVEREVNSVILSDVEVKTELMSLEKAKQAGAMALFSEKYGDTVRVVSVADYSMELCGGTHASSTGTIGLFKIISESSVAAGVRRIEAVTGENLLSLIDYRVELLARAAAAIKLTNYKELDVKCEALMAQLKQKDNQIKKLSDELSKIKTGSMLENEIQVGSVKLVCAMVQNVQANELRKMSDMIKQKGEDYVGVVVSVNEAAGTGSICTCCGKSAIEAGAHAGSLAKQVAALAGGSGGGRPDSAMAGFKDASRAEQALGGAKDILASMLK